MNTVNDHAYLNMNSVEDQLKNLDDNNNEVIVKNSTHTSNVNAVTNKYEERIVT